MVSKLGIFDGFLHNSEITKKLCLAIRGKASLCYNGLPVYAMRERVNRYTANLIDMLTLSA